MDTHSDPDLSVVEPTVLGETTLALEGTLDRILRTRESDKEHFALAIDFVAVYSAIAARMIFRCVSRTSG